MGGRGSSLCHRNRPPEEVQFLDGPGLTFKKSGAGGWALRAVMSDLSQELEPGVSHCHGRPYCMSDSIILALFIRF